MGLVLSDAEAEIVSKVLDGIKTLFGPASAELGELAGDQVGFWRWKNRLNIVEKARKILEDRGIEPTAASIPPRLSVPLIEAIGNEDDETVQRLWAGLMANAADSSRQQQVTRAFIHILNSIDPLEASILEWLQPLLAGADPNKHGVAIETTRMCDDLEVSEAELKFCLYHLASLGCFRVATSALLLAAETFRRDPWPYIVAHEVEFRPTELAVALIQACSGDIGKASIRS